jgi:Spy/CpxP family protein refolding chaperone
MRWTCTPLLALALAVPAVAQPGPGRAGAPGPGFEYGRGGSFDTGLLAERLEHRSDRLAYALDLTTDQRAAFDRLRDQRIAEVKTLADQLRATDAELNVMLDAPQPEAAAVGQKLIALHEMHARMKGERRSFDAELLKILTPEQQAVYNALERLRAERPEGMMTMRRGGMMMRGGDMMRHGAPGAWHGRRDDAPPPPDDGD